MESAGLAEVFDITVADAHEFFANGILVSNSDALGYLAAREWPPAKRAVDARIFGSVSV